MKNNRKALFTLCASAMLLLTSCGGGNDSKPTSEDKSQTPTSAKSNDSKEENSSKPNQEGESSKSAESNVPVSQYTVTFNYNYTGSRPTQVKVDSGSKVEKPADPERDGYGFAGWYTEIGCTNLFDFDTPIVKNTVLFAGWDASSITVSYNFNYVGAPAIVTQTIAKGSVITPIEDPVREYYSFVSWCTDQAGQTAFDFSLPVNESLTLYAKWTLSTAVVTFDLGYETDDRTSTSNVSVGSALAEPADPARTGYTFSGWYEDGATSPYDFSSVVDANFTLTARWEILVLTVTFDFNDAGKENVVVNVNYGETVEEVENIRAGYISMWMYGNEEFNFETPITSNITLVAAYQQESSDSFTYTYYYNYDGAPNGGVFTTQNVQKDNRPTNPGAPSRTDALFAGWYLDANGTTPLSFATSRASANTSVYARWLVQNRFEAEYVNLDGKEGHGFSVNMSGKDMVFPDNGTGASNGHYVSGLYYEGANIEFVINSDRAVDDAVIVMAVQVEFDTKTFNPENYKITVNDTELDYDEFEIEAGIEDSMSDTRRPFIEVELNDLAEFIEGQNSIKMITANSIYHGGTRQGDAPMIDYIDIFTDATLSWTPRTDNLE